MGEFFVKLGASLATFAAKAPKLSVREPANNPFPNDPVVTKWMAVFIDIEEAARLLGVVLPEAALIANDMRIMQPLVPYILRALENAKPIAPGDPAWSRPTGNADAYSGGSDNANI